MHNKNARFQNDPLKTVRRVDYTNSIPYNAKSCLKWISSKGCNSVKIKVVICGKYENLNKISLYSLQFTMQNIGLCCLEKCFNTERPKGIFVREHLKK